VELAASFDPRDKPFILACSLGEGEHNWPDTDWNKIALWRMVAEADSRAAQSLLQGLAYHADASADVFERMASTCSAAIEKYGAGFLAGDFGALRSIRSAVNAEREPYKTTSLGTDGELQTRYEEASELLRRKYVQ
jgi:hypothetical protein